MVRELEEVQGIIFKRKKYKEADALCKVFSKERGIFTLDIRGAYRPKSKLGPATLNYSFGNYVINTSGKGISTLRTYKNIKQFDQIFNDLVKQAYASYLLDLVDHAFIEYQSLGPTYDLIFTALQRINENIDPEVIKQMVELKVLQVYGVKPQLKACIICGKEQGIFDYSLEKGGIVCNEHFHLVPERMHLNPKVVALLRTLALVRIERLGAININEKLKFQTKKVINRMYSAYLDLNLKSKKFLDELSFN